jgi:hypothetical protein
MKASQCLRVRAIRAMPKRNLPAWLIVSSKLFAAPAARSQSVLEHLRLGAGVAVAC